LARVSIFVLEMQKESVIKTSSSRFHYAWVVLAVGTLVGQWLFSVPLGPYSFALLLQKYSAEIPRYCDKSL
jgi:hypothetical protein